MFGDIARFLLNTLFTLFGVVLVLRAWMQAARVSPYNPITQSILQATNWLVSPLRRIVPAGRTVDWACIVGACLTALVYVVLMLASAGFDLASMVPALLLVAVLTVTKWALDLILWLTIAMALLSWVNPTSPAYALLDQLTSPFLTPLRRVLPRFGNLDLSPLILFVIVQVLIMVVTRAAASLTLFGI